MTEKNIGVEETVAVVLFYPTGIVHFRNLEILKRNIPGLRFRVIIEPWVMEKAADLLTHIAKEDLAIVAQNRLPETVWADTDILFLSMAYPNPFRLYLVYEAARRNIPVTAIEEVNQLALNDGIINHYFLPIDSLGVPSEIEKEKFLELGLNEETITVTGWPFFNEEVVVDSAIGLNIRKEYQIPAEKKCALLVLGSLKEFDIVSLETRQVRHKILEIVAAGLPAHYQLVIKPHPIESASAQKEIQAQVPNAILLDPKLPIEPLLTQSDLVVNRGNSQVTLLAMLQNIPLILVPVELRTLFHGVADSLLCDSLEQFQQCVNAYDAGNVPDYSPLIRLHFPLNQEEALGQVAGLFEESLTKGADREKPRFHFISILFAFLGNMEKANQVLDRFPGGSVTPLLKQLYAGEISITLFQSLLACFPGLIPRWHLQALFVRMLTGQKKPLDLSAAVTLLEGFDGAVNPHYFFPELVARVELEFRAGRQDIAQQLMAKFYENYSVYPYYRQVFNMMHFVYSNHQKGHSLRKTLWLLTHLFTNYSRKYFKDKYKAKK